MRSSFLRFKATRWIFVIVLLTAAFVLEAADVSGQSEAQDKKTKPASQLKESSDKPPYSDYKGVKLGMAALEVRQKLGKPTDEGKVQDYYVFSEKETVQVFYDEAEKTSAIAVTYVGKSSGAPSPEQIIGTSIGAKPDGSMYKMVQYPDAGFLLTYTRTAGDDPLTVITIQKMRSPASK